MSVYNRYSLVESFIFYAFLLLLVIAPIPFASKYEWAFSWLQVYLFVLMIIWVSAFVAKRVKWSYVSTQLVFVWWLFGLFVGWTFLQSVDWSGLKFRQVSYLNDQVLNVSNLSLALEKSRLFFQQSLAYLVAFFIVVQVVNNENRVKTLLWVLILSGLFQAIVAGLLALSFSEVAHGFFTNRNHLSGYLEMTTALGIGLLMMKSRLSYPADNWRKKIVLILVWLASPKMRLRLILALMVVVIVLTRSRMGNIAFFVSLITTGGIWLWSQKKSAWKAGLVLLMSVLILDVYILGQWFGFDQVVQRLQNTDRAEMVRDDVYLDAYQLFKVSPVLGVGGGGFKEVFPSYRGESAIGRNAYHYAHNDYVQMVLEVGLLGGACLLLIVLLALKSVIRAMLFRNNPLFKALAFGGCMGIVAILVHSLADFNLQIAANGLTFVVLIGLAFVSDLLKTRGGRV